jgi:hypothetical protein
MKRRKSIFLFISQNQSLTLFLVFVLISLPLTLSSQEYSVTQRIVERFTGPFHMRLLFQPLIAIILGIRNGSHDAREGNPPYIFEVFSNRSNRRDIIYEGIRAILIPLIIGIILDAIFQYMIFSKIRFYGSIIVGIVIIGLPYSLSRGITNRIKSKKNKSKS